MLVLSRKLQEAIVIGSAGAAGLVRVTIVGIRGGKVKLGIEVDADVAVHRSEIYDRLNHGGPSPDAPTGAVAAPCFE